MYALFGQVHRCDRRGQHRADIAGTPTTSGFPAADLTICDSDTSRICQRQAFILQHLMFLRKVGLVYIHQVVKMNKIVTQTKNMLPEILTSMMSGTAHLQQDIP